MITHIGPKNKENLILAASRDWPAGIIGLVAGKLAQNYGKPAILLHLDKNGNAAGSCRSVPEINIFAKKLTRWRKSQRQPGLK